MQTIDETQDNIISEFSQLHDWFEKYEYLIDLGKKHQSIDEQFKVEQYALQGCQSQVWIAAKLCNEKVSFESDSDSIIIRGILSLLMRVLNNHLPQDIATANLYFIKEIGLSTALSPSRANGVSAIVNQMQHLGEILDGH